MVDSTGAPVADAQVGVDAQQQPKGHSHRDAFGHLWTGSALSRETTDESGVATLEFGETPHALVLWVYPPSTQHGRHTEVAEHGWNGSDTTVRLPKSRRIAGRVVDDANRPVAGARVGWWRSTGWQQTWADAAGAFTFPSVSGEEILLRAHRNDYLPATDVRVPKDSTGPVLVTIERGVDLRVSVPNLGSEAVRAHVAVEGAPEVRGPVVVERGEGRDLWCRGLPRGTRVTLWIEPTSSGHVLYARGIDVDPGAATLSLEMGGVIDVRVRGAPAGADVRVSLVVERGFAVLHGVPRGDGFRVEGVPTGRWRLVASATSGEDRYSAETTVSESATVDLDLRKE